MIFRSADHPVEVRKAMRGGPGEAVLTKLLAENPAHMRLFNTITLKPGCGIGYHVHENETELFYLISGRGLFHDDDATVELKAGDSMATGNGHGHSVECLGDEPLVMLACIVLD